MKLLTNLPNPPTNDRENTKMNFFWPPPTKIERDQTKIV